MHNYVRDSTDVIAKVYMCMHVLTKLYNLFSLQNF